MIKSLYLQSQIYYILHIWYIVLIYKQNKYYSFSFIKHINSKGKYIVSIYKYIRDHLIWIYTNTSYVCRSFERQWPIRSWIVCMRERMQVFGDLWYQFSVSLYTRMYAAAAALRSPRHSGLNMRDENLYSK